MAGGNVCTLTESVDVMLACVGVKTLEIKTDANESVASSTVCVLNFIVASASVITSSYFSVSVVNAWA